MDSCLLLLIAVSSLIMVVREKMPFVSPLDYPALREMHPELDWGQLPDVGILENDLFLVTFGRLLQNNTREAYILVLA